MRYYRFYRFMSIELSAEHAAETLILNKNLLKLRRIIVRTVRDPYVETSPNEQSNALLELSSRGASSTSYLTPNFVSDLLIQQTGSVNWEIADEDRQLFAPDAIKRMADAQRVSSFSLWPFLLLKEENADLRAGFLNEYTRLAVITGNFPCKPTLDAIPRQREIDWKVRLLAAQIIFVNKCIESDDVTSVAISMLKMVKDAIEVYKPAGIEKLQSLLLAKSGKIPSEFKRCGLYNNLDELALMCVDKGLRDLVTGYFGIFRNISLSNISGYQTGHEIGGLTVLARRCL